MGVDERLLELRLERLAIELRGEWQDEFHRREMRRLNRQIYGIAFAGPILTAMAVLAATAAGR